MQDIARIYEESLVPSGELVADMARLEGDIIILGVGGKMGPGIARMARQAADKAGVNKKIIGVARFSDPALKESLNREGIETISADLLDDQQLQA